MRGALCRVRLRHRERARGRSERGATMIVAMIVLMALVTAGTIAATSVRSSLTAAGQDRFRTMALYAAESGLASAYVYLRRELVSDTDPDRDNWSLLFDPSDPAAPIVPETLLGNDIEPGEEGATLTPSARTWFHVEIRNNESDPGFLAGRDDDGIVIVSSTGYAPKQTAVQVEVELRSNGNFPLDGGRPCPSYAQEALAEDGSGRNDCLDEVIGTAATTVTYRPGS